MSADLISTLNLKGRYRLENNKIFFTIVSKAIVDSADIGVKEPALYFGIFDYENIVSKVIIIKNPKEIKDPATIVVIKPNHLQINNMDYYKVSSNPDDADKL